MVICPTNEAVISRESLLVVVVGPDHVMCGVMSVSHRVTPSPRHTVTSLTTPSGERRDVTGSGSRPGGAGRWSGLAPISTEQQREYLYINTNN